MTPGAHIEVLVRGEWIAVEVTHVPLEAGHSYIGRTRDGFKLSWPVDAEMRAGVGATIAERVELYRPREADVLRSQLDEARNRIAALEGRCAGLEMRALLAEEEREETLERVRAIAPRIADEWHGRALSLMDRPFDEPVSQLLLAMHWGAALTTLVERLRVIIVHDEERMVGAHDASIRGYTIGRRDGLRVGEHRDALVRDVLRSAEAMHTDGTRHEECVLGDAMRVWIAAGRPGAEEG